jgi:hypothetical protein
MFSPRDSIIIWSVQDQYASYISILFCPPPLLNALMFLRDPVLSFRVYVFSCVLSTLEFY